ncbi:MAG: alpha/beta hydrolase [Chloroflexota bacterium]
MKKGYVSIPEGQIHYREDGKGEPVLLLHQTPTSSDDYSLVIPLLAASFRVIAMDTMGYGMSDPPPGQFAIPDYARTVIEFLKTLKLKRAAIVGHHTGSSIAVETAASSPGMVSKLVLSGCPHYLPEVRQSRLTDPRFTPMEYKEDASHIFKFWNSFKNIVPEGGPEVWSKVVIGGLQAGRRGEEGHHAVFNYDIEPRLKQLKCPVLLLSGTKDTFFDRLEATRALIPNCKVAIIEGGGPLITLTKPAEFVQTVMDFLRA